MRVVTRIMLALAVAVTVSCDWNGSGEMKELTAVFDDVFAFVDQAAGSSGGVISMIVPADTAAAATSVNVVSGVEIPAPLTGVPEQILARKAYTTSYNKDTRLPNWVAWHLTNERISGTASRDGKSFEEDNEAEGSRADSWDYYNSGYDRGHMCPAADNKWDDQAMTESFLYTNICPQLHSLNAGDWEDLEKQCRQWAREYGDIYVVCGPVLSGASHKTIGKHKVVVPEAFFKVVLCTAGEPKAIGFIYKNAGGDKAIGDYAVTVDDVERVTRMDFFPSLPDEVENMIEASYDVSQWRWM